MISEFFVSREAKVDRLSVPLQASEGEGRAMVFIRPGGGFRVGRK